MLVHRSTGEARYMTLT